MTLAFKIGAKNNARRRRTLAVSHLVACPPHLPLLRSSAAFVNFQQFVPAPAARIFDAWKRRIRAGLRIRLLIERSSYNRLGPRSPLPGVPITAALTIFTIVRW